MQKIGVMQDFPNRAKRQAEVELAKAELGSVTAQTEILRIELRQKVASAWFKRFYLERKLALYDELFSENRLLSQMTQTQVTSGRTMVADALDPKQEATVLLDQKDDLLRDLNKAKLELHRLISADHEAIPAINWPAMKMGFKVADPSLLNGLTVGDKVDFELKTESENQIIVAVKKSS